MTTFWFGTGYGKNVHINWGEIVFFRSDMVHAGGRPVVDTSKNQRFNRLHFYLSTDFQKADPNFINYWHHDLKTKLKHIYLHPKLQLSDSESSDEESDDDEHEEEEEEENNEEGYTEDKDEEENWEDEDEFEEENE